MTYAALAKKAGYRTASGIQKFLTSPEIFSLQPKIAAKFAGALFGKGDPPIGLEDLAGLVNATLDGPDAITKEALARLLNIELKSLKGTGPHIQDAPAGRMPVVGSAHASYWMPSSPSIDEPEDWLTIPFTSSKPMPNQYALRIVGPSVNRTAPEGHYAICEKFGGNVHDIVAGKFVHAQREREHEIEWTIKKAKWSKDGLLLCPDSDHPDYKDAIAFGVDGDTVIVRGIVIGWYKPA